MPRTHEKPGTESRRIPAGGGVHDRPAGDAPGGRAPAGLLRPDPPDPPPVRGDRDAAGETPPVQGEAGRPEPRGAAVHRGHREDRERLLLVEEVDLLGTGRDAHRRDRPADPLVAGPRARCVHRRREVSLLQGDRATGADLRAREGPDCRRTEHEQHRRGDQCTCATPDGSHHHRATVPVRRRWAPGTRRLHRAERLPETRTPPRGVGEAFDQEGWSRVLRRLAVWWWWWSWRESNPRPRASNQVFSGCSP